jgi:hypothetical protein
VTVLHLGTARLAPAAGITAIHAETTGVPIRHFVVSLPTGSDNQIEIVVQSIGLQSIEYSCMSTAYVFSTGHERRSRFRPCLGPDCRRLTRTS